MNASASEADDRAASEATFRVTIERFKQVQQIFGRAYELPPDARKRYVAQACGDDSELLGEVTSLLAADAGSGNFLEGPALDSSAGSSLLHVFTKAHAANQPTYIDGYRVIERFGSGSMGVVYRAEQTKPRREVAIKLLRTGLTTPAAIRRFEFEAAALARLQHSGIAQVYATGTATLDGESRPYIVMELVRGTPLTQYADAENLSLTDRLDLLAKVADAIQHAHQRGIIHRDLKPANILVSDEATERRSDEGEEAIADHPFRFVASPKVLDFGIARVTSDLTHDGVTTEAGALLGTLAYMSPEQLAASDEVDTRCDVYALGVIGYELLGGRLPFETRGVAPASLLRTIESDSPTRLGLLNRACRGDIELVIGKAMHRDRSQRYESAAALAADIRALLGGRAIAARPATTTYQLRILYRRHRAATVGATLALAGLISGGVLAIRYAVIAADDRDRARAAERIAASRLREVEAARTVAQSEAEIAGAVTAFLQTTLESADPGRADRGGATVREALDRAQRNIDVQFADKPHVEAAVRLTIGKTYAALGEYGEAEQNLRRVLQLDETVGTRRTDPLVQLGIVLREAGRLDEAESTLVAAVKLASDAESGSDAPGERASEAATAQYILATVLVRKGAYADAIQLHETAFAARCEALGENALEVAESLDALGVALRHVGKHAQAEANYRRALKIRRECQRPDHPDIAVTLHNLSRTLHSLARFEESEQAVRDALAIQWAAYGEAHPNIALSQRSLALALESLGRFQEAYAALADAQAMYESLYPDGHGDLGMTLILRARIAARLQLSDDAERWIASATSMVERLGNHSDRLSLRTAVVQHYTRTGRADRALPIAEQHLADVRGTFGDAHIDVATALTSIAEVAMMQRDWPRSTAAIAESVTVLRAALGGDHPRVAEAMHNHAYVAHQSGDREAAIGIIVDAIERRRNLLGATHPDTIESEFEHGLILYELKRDDDAAAVLDACRQKYIATPGPAAAIRVSDCAILLDGIAERRGDPSESSIEALQSALKHIEAIVGESDKRLVPLINTLGARLVAANREVEAAELRARISRIQSQ
ncbi:MAG: tetratricopeptide repeat protein [Phycisphaerae bacterium]